MTPTIDDSQLAGLDPFDLLDAEAGRLERFFAGLSEAEWARPSRCEGWSTRDMLGHLAATEDYHRACLEGRVQEFIAEEGKRGATDLDSFNALGVADFAGRPAKDALAEWAASNAESRRRFRERGDGVVDTSVGDYPCRWQAFHLASELAIHADDIGLPETAREREGRRDWRSRFSRFALTEAKPDMIVSVEAAGRTRVRGQGVDAVVDDDELIEGVAGRLDASHPLGAVLRA